jgi:acyl-coenzyme A thioesterase PaaI-like protein
MKQAAPSGLSAAVAAARAGGDPAALVEAIPYLGFLGLKITVDGDDLICHLPPSRKLIGNPVLPALHGGVVGALLESAAILQLMWASELDHVPRIVDLSVDYLRSAQLLDTYAKGVITRQGRRVANVRVEAWQEDRARPVAAAHAHFLLASPK